MASLLLIAAHPAASAGQGDKPASQDSLKKRAAREKAFLMRAVEELDKAREYAKESAAILEEQSAVPEAPEQKKLTSDLADIRDWYQKYANWLDGMAAELDADLSEHFSRGRAGTGWTGRYEAMSKGYQKLAAQLAGKVRELEAAKVRIETRMRKQKQVVQDRRLLVDKEDLELAKQLWPVYRSRTYDHREAVYKDLTDPEVELFRNELRSLGEQQTHLEVLTEVGQYEVSWVSMKTEDCAALDNVARAIAGDAPGPIADASRSLIRTYESDMTTFKRKAGEIDAKRGIMTQTGTLTTLKQAEDLSRYYENIKSRYERHREWLGWQVGGLQADLVELGRER